MHHQIDPIKKALTVAIPGNILSTNVEALREEILGLISPGVGASKEWTNLVLDLSTTKMIDSAGLNFLVSLVRNVATLGGKVQAISLQPNILRTFKFTRLEQHIEIVAAPAPAAR